MWLIIAQCVTSVLNPCPVDIDFGDVTILMRHILKSQGQRKSHLGTKLSMAFLNVTDPATIKLMRNTLIRFGYWGQRMARRVLKLLPGVMPKTRRPSSTTGKPEVKEQVIQFFSKPMPAGLPAKTMRGLLGVEDDKTVPILRNPKPPPLTAKRSFIFLDVARSVCSARLVWLLWPGYMN